MLHKVPVANHHGDLCLHDGKLYVAVNLGKFNDPAGNADSWVYVYRADDLAFVARHAVPEVFHGAGGIGMHGGRFFVVGGLPDDIRENYVYEYDERIQVHQKAHDRQRAHAPRNSNGHVCRRPLVAGLLWRPKNIACRRR